MKRVRKTPEMQEFNQHVGRRIRDAREQELGWTRDQLAERLGMSYSWIAEIESGENSISAFDLCHIAELASYPLAWFVDPEFAPVTERQPRSRFEWDALYPGEPERSAAHAELDKVFKRASHPEERRHGGSGGGSSAPGSAGSGAAAEPMQSRRIPLVLAGA